MDAADAAADFIITFLGGADIFSYNSLKQHAAGDRSNEKKKDLGQDEFCMFSLSLSLVLGLVYLAHSGTAPKRERKRIPCVDDT